MSAPAWYSDWRHDAVHELIRKNDKLAAQFGTNDLPRWDYDLDARTLTFSDKKGPRVVAAVVLIGTTSNKLKNWQWGWAKSNWPPEAVAGVEAVKEFGEANQIDELMQGWVDPDEDSEGGLNHLGWELTSVAVRVLDGLGAYRPQDDDGAMFFLYRDIRRVS